MAELSAVSHHAPRRLSRWLWFSALFAALAFCLWPSWKAGDAPSVGPSPLQQARLDAQSLAAGQKLPTAPIETLRCGLRVLGTNPEIAPDELPPEPSPKTDRLIRLRMVRPSGKPLDVALIRPLDWLADRQATVGDTVELDLPEMGAAGQARVEAIEPCPPLEGGSGNLITGLFVGEPEAPVVDVHLAGLDKPIGCTATHPFWSEDRRAFTPAGELQPGERVRSRAEQISRVLSIQPRPDVRLVYNIEVHGQHVYEVTDLGVLAHNCSVGKPPPKRGSRNAKVRAAAAKGRQKHREFADRVRQKPGWKSEKTIKGPSGETLRPDAITPSGRPVELKPNTPSGRAQGARQIKKYKLATGQNGRVIYYDP